ncbi:MAG TPA: hypothetical protein VG711_02950, partial [Phycisphaerales bacterium]|nr:hypothetical protein [Phycisphaerales bacterium]
PGTQLTAVIAIGQNRWMFATSNQELVNMPGPGGRMTQAMRISLPETVERCQRRNFYRVQTASLQLPQLEIWPLLEPRSVVLAERASELRSMESSKQNAEASAPLPKITDSAFVMPEVGPKFTASMLNIGGGGIGIRVLHTDSQHLVRHKLFWLRIPLAPVMNEPVCATGKLVHTHIESTHDMYGGLAFDFTFNPAHQRFVAQQICRYIALLQQGPQEVEQTPYSGRRSA